jgi:predicted nucleic acid-binding protein
VAEGSDLPLVVVCDAGPIIHLDQLCSLDLLADFAEVLVPETVWDEVSRHRPMALRGRPKLTRTKAPEISSAELEALGRVLSLHQGEQEALRLAEATLGCVLLTDDTAARLAGRNLGLTVHGTIGIVVRALRRQQRTKEQVLEILRSLPTHCTLHVRPSLLKEVIQEILRST